MSRDLVLLVLIASVTGCTRNAAPTATVPTHTSQEVGEPVKSLEVRRNAAIRSGSEFLSKQQSTEGIWSSDVYATFRDGTALTPFVLLGLQSADVAEQVESRNAAAMWLAKKAGRYDTVLEGGGIPYLIYTASFTVMSLSHHENRELSNARDTWLKYLLARQLIEHNGWDIGDKQYGGWGYYPDIPRKPKPGVIIPAQQLLESNLSATVCSVEALKSAGVTDSKVLDPAKRFVLSCQNEDGGFHFIYDDPVRNKAGVSQKPGAAPIYNSYGSATADGVRALLLCGAKLDDPRVVAGRAWLVKHFAADTHPGEYIPTHERNRNAVYFYYTRSVAKTLRLLGEKELKGRHWSESLSEALIAMQKADGSWENPADQQRENDPLLATAYAVSALAECRNALAAK